MIAAEDIPSVVVSVFPEVHEDVAAFYSDWAGGGRRARVAPLNAVFAEVIIPRVVAPILGERPPDPERSRRLLGLVERLLAEGDEDVRIFVQTEMLEDVRTACQDRDIYSHLGVVTRDALGMV